MLNFLMEKLVPMILLVMLLGLCLFVGVLPAQAAVSGGAWSVLLWGLVAAVIMAAIAASLGPLFADMIGIYRRRVSSRVVAALLACICTLVLPVRTLVTGHSTAEHLRTMAPVVRIFALERFDEIDADGNGTITDGEMEQATDKMRLSGAERAALSHMRGQLSEIGHVIDSYTTTTFIWIGDGNGGGYMMPMVTTYYLYGIGKQDLATYPARVVEKYKQW